MDAKKGEDNSKVTQIKIHGVTNDGSSRKNYQQISKTAKQMTEKRDDDKRERSKGPETTNSN